MHAFEEKELFLAETNLPFSVFIAYKPDIEFHWHEHLEMLYLIRGKAIIYINNNNFDIMPGDFFIINSKELHKVSCQKKSEFLIIQFKPSLINPDLNSLYEIKYLLPFLQKELLYKKQVNIEDNNDIKRYLTEIQYDFLERYSGYELSIKGNIYKIFSRLIKNKYFLMPTHKELGKLDISRISALLEYVRNHYHERITDEIAAKITFMSYHHFCRVFKRIMGKSFIEYLNYVRLCEAEKQLISTKKTISEIAMDVGFSSTSYFIKIFKKERGITPQIYRNVATVSK